MLCTPHIEKDFTAGNFVRDAGGLIPLSPYKGLIFSPVVILAALGIFRLHQGEFHRHPVASAAHHKPW